MLRARGFYVSLFQGRPVGEETLRTQPLPPGVIASDAQSNLASCPAAASGSSISQLAPIPQHDAAAGPSSATRR